MGQVKQWAKTMLDHELTPAFQRSGSLENAIRYVVNVNTVDQPPKIKAEYERMVRAAASNPMMFNHSIHYWQYLSRSRVYLRLKRGVYIKGKESKP